MRRILLPLLLLLLCHFPLQGRGGKVTAAVEWGAGMTFADYHIYNYLLEGGYRMNGSEFYFGGKVNAYWQGSLGYDILPDWNLSLNAGYEGIDRQYRVYPITVRATHTFQPANEDGYLLFVEGGAGFWGPKDISAVLGRVGTGYRLALSPRTALDLMFSFRLSMRNPDLFDPDSTHPILQERIVLNQLYSGKLTVSVALSFR